MTAPSSRAARAARAADASAAVRTIDAQTARRFLVTRHLLAPPRSLTGGEDAVRAVFRRLGSIQFDPLNVAGRNHDLVLHARVAGYDPAWTDRLLYDTRELFEAYNKGLSLLPTSELPWFRVTWERALEAHRDAAFVRHADAIDHILGRIRAEGPLSSLQFEKRARVDWWWGPTNETRAALEALAHAGVLGLARRDGNRRFFDLTERLFPRELLARRVDEREQVKHKLLSRYRGHGLLGTGGQAEIFLGTGRASTPASDEPTRRELHAELVSEGELVPLNVGGVRGPRFVLREELPVLDAAERDVSAGGGAPAAVSFLAPLDPLAWDRDLLRSLFGFDYVWEVYVPEPRRRWGYYVLPLLFGDRLVGRIEPRIDRVSASVRILGLWWEPGFEPHAEDGFVDAMREALAAYLRFAGARRVRWAPGLGRERRLFGTMPGRARAA